MGKACHARVAETDKMSNDTKKIIRQLVGTESKDTIINELKVNGNLINDPEIMAHKFNDYFTGLLKSFADKTPESTKEISDYMSPPTLNYVVLLPISH